MKKIILKILKIISIIFLLLIGLIVIVFLFFYLKSVIQSKKNKAFLGVEAPILQKGNMRFRDLNKNGKLDIYEDATKNLNNRVEDLLSQLTLEEKAGLMFINIISMNQDGSISDYLSLSNPFSLMSEASSTMIARKKMNHFNILQSLTPEALINWNNHIQKMAERTRLGIPVTIASDPRHGVENAPGLSISSPYFSHWCSPIGFAAIGDTALTRTFGDIARQEYKAVGIRLTLSPMADLATEPRWARINGTFGEDAALAAKLTKAYILGFQGDSISTESVECMVKHFSGGGPQDKGFDAHFPPGKQAYPGNNFAYHLIPFEKGAFPAKVAQIMPYYGIPVGQTSEDVGFAFNKEIVTGMIREKYHFDGIICTDWALISDGKIFGIMLKPASAHGVEKLSISERVEKVINAGCDMFGGESLPSVVVDLVKSGKIKEERINTSVRRILKEKFKLGLFDNPYLDKKNVAVFNNKTFKEKGIESQQRSLVLLKNDKNILPLKSGVKIYLHGFSKTDNSIYSNTVKTPQEADLIILKINTPYISQTTYPVQRMFHEGSLAFQDKEKNELLSLIKLKPTITIINLERPAVIPEINNASSALIADFGSENYILLDLIFGKFKPQGKLPFELPSSMEAVYNQKEDVPSDSKNPLYNIGYGLSYK